MLIMSAIYKAVLTAPQKEELIELIVKDARGVVERAQNGVLKYQFKNSEAVFFNGKEDVYKLAEKNAFNWESQAVSGTSLDGLAHMQAWQKAFEAISEAIQYAPRNKGKVGYKDLPSAIMQGLEEQGIKINVAEPELLWKEIVNIPSIAESLPETCKIPFDGGRRNPIVKSMLKCIESAGLEFYIPGDRKRLDQHVKINMRTDPSAPEMITGSAQFKMGIVEQAERYAKAKIGPLAFSRLVHRSCNNRNISMMGESESGVYPSEFMSPNARKTLINIYKLASQGDVDALNKEVDKLSFKYVPLTVSVSDPSRQNNVSEVIQQRLSYIKGVSDARAELVSAKKEPHVVDVEAFRASFDKERGKVESLINTGCVGEALMRLSTLNRWMSPLVYSASPEMRDAAIAALGGDYESAHSLQIEKINSEILLTNNALRDLLGRLKDADPDVHVSINEKDFAFKENSRIPLGVSANTAETMLKEYQSSVLEKLDAAANGVNSTAEFVAIVKNFKSTAAEPVIEPVVAPVVEPFIEPVIEQPNEPTEELIENGIQTDQINEPLPGVVSPDMASPEHGLVIEPPQEVEEEAPSPSNEVIVEQPIKPKDADLPVVTSLSLSDAVDGAVIKASLIDLQDRLFELPFDRNDELVLPDEMEWLQQMWEDIVGNIESIESDEISVVYNEAMEAFSPISQTKSRKKLTDWYLDNANLSIQRELYNKLSPRFDKFVESHLSEGGLAFIKRLKSAYFSSVTNSQGEMPYFASGEKAEKLVSDFESNLIKFEESPSSLSGIFKAHESLSAVILQWQKLAHENGGATEGYDHHLNEALASLDLWDKSSTDLVAKKLSSAIDDSSMMKIISSFDGDVKRCDNYTIVDSIVHQKDLDCLSVRDFSNEVVSQTNEPEGAVVTRKRV